MSADAPPRKPETSGATSKNDDAPRLVILIGLLALADVLLWQVCPGVSFAVFGAAILGAAWLVLDRPVDNRQGAAALACYALAISPIIELVQPISLMFYLIGMSAALALLVAPSNALVGAARFWRYGFKGTIFDLVATMRGQTELSVPPVKQVALVWGLPLGLGLIFASLLIDANPMLEKWAAELFDVGTRPVDPVRPMFWAGMAFLIWPCLTLTRLRARITAPLRPKSAVPVPSFINAASIARSLILFNALFLLQTGTDALFLWSDLALPDGMTYAAYAHRGAYPLVATALLAGMFALISRPFTEGSSILRVALLFWVLQNVALVVSSLYRLDLYVGTYGLTRLRMAAALWMGVVGAGLILTLWQVWQGRASIWLLTRTAALGAVVFYATAFVSFDRVIAQYNLTRPVPLDRNYVCHLGPSALPAIRNFEFNSGRLLCNMAYRPRFEEINDWREWGFRHWRLRRTLDVQEKMQAAK